MNLVTWTEASPELRADAIINTAKLDGYHAAALWLLTEPRRLRDSRIWNDGVKILPWPHARVLKDLGQMVWDAAEAAGWSSSERAIVWAARSLWAGGENAARANLNIGSLHSCDDATVDRILQAMRLCYGLTTWAGHHSDEIRRLIVPAAVTS